jgi:glycosyltransferase involved in cell wall biosynthesis
MLGRLEGEKLGSAIAAARAVIAPSIWHENMPLAVLEALARGKAVIASRAGGLEEIIQDGENGFLFEAGNRRELGKIIGRFDRRKFSAAGQALPEKYSAENHLRLTMDVYQKVLANFK